MMRSHGTSAARRLAARLLLGGSVLVLTAFEVASVRGQIPAGPRWVGAWAAAATARVDSPSSTPTSSSPPESDGQLPIGGQSPLHVKNQTLRQIAHLSIGGTRLRVAVSNTFGTAPLVIGAAQIALHQKESSIVPQSNRVLTFSGNAALAIPPGATFVSDPVDITVPDFSDVVVDLFLPDDTAAMKSPITIHPASWQTNYVSRGGNYAGAVSFPVETTTKYRRTDGAISATSFFLARVEVVPTAPAGAVVTLGDSITDGTHSGLDANNRWPDHLARRLAGANIRMAVMNVGIGGNRILVDGNGPSALSRLDRDVLAQPGVTHVVFFEGINDIGQARESPSPSADDLVAAHRQIIERVRARGLKIFGATLTPFEGANYWTPQGEAKRQALNRWIRTGKAFDAVIDFDAAVRDPQHPTRTLASFDPGDHLHMNAAGYRAMADAIDLSLFRPTGK
jgi:lysophospholipase L1-like esterase